MSSDTAPAVCRNPRCRGPVTSFILYTNGTVPIFPAVSMPCGHRDGWDYTDQTKSLPGIQQEATGVLDLIDADVRADLAATDGSDDETPRSS